MAEGRDGSCLATRSVPLNQTRTKIAAGKDAFRAAAAGQGDAPAVTIDEDQALCLAKNRNGASIPPIPVIRKHLKYQRFQAPAPK